MKKLLFLAIVFLTILFSSIQVQAKERITGTVIPITAQIGTMLELFNDSITMYTTTETNIYEQPSSEAQILECSMVNTSFEVISQNDDWSMIATSNGYGFIESLYLSDDEVNSYTDEELYTIAHILAGEAQSLPDEEQRYVGSVVLNRVKHKAFPNTIEGVVFQKGQYTCVKDGNYYREPTKRNWANARWLLENGGILPDHVVWQSGGKQGKHVYTKTKWHYYCY